MYRKTCSNKLAENDVFCTKCGTKQETENQTTNNSDNLQPQPQTISQSQPVQTQNNEKAWKNTASIVIGNISLVAVFIFQILTIPLSIVGLVFGISSFKDNKKHKIGMILSMISLCLAIPLSILYSAVLGRIANTLLNPTIGTWDCKNFNNGDNEDLDYAVTMKLNNAGQFKWSKYGEEDNNYIIGNYEATDLHKTNYSETVDYFSIKMAIEKHVDGGVSQTQEQDYNLEYEMGIMRESDEAVMINSRTMRLYYCYRHDTNSPKIDE